MATEHRNKVFLMISSTETPVPGLSFSDLKFLL